MFYSLFANLYVRADDIRPYEKMIIFLIKHTTAGIYAVFLMHYFRVVPSTYSLISTLTVMLFFMKFRLSASSR